MKCPSCNIEMEPLVAGIFQCPQCRKILKQTEEKVEKQLKKIIEEGEFQDGEYFHKNLSLNKSYEVCEKGIVVYKSSNYLMAVLICKSSYKERYIRLSWWKNSQHAGLFKIYDKEVLKNTIKVLEKIDESFDEFWNWKGKYGRSEQKTEEELSKEKKMEIIKARIIENRTCPNCQNKMEKNKSHYICQHCSEIVILEGYNQPVFSISPSDLDLTFHSNFPINYYMPVSGITVKWLVGEWKAIVIIYSKDNPNKKWLRFYWWVRDLTNFIKFGKREIGNGVQMGWKAQKGIASPNIFDKKLIKPLIIALKNISIEMEWDID
ncbi:MAG: hypothetical protein ACFFEO_00185 [Candidatus Thorarchaeota archaeon]